MLVWHDEKYWKYCSRGCAVQTADFGDGDTMYRAAVEVDDVIAADVDLDRILPVDGHVTTSRRMKRRHSDESATWVCAKLDANEDTDLAELVDRTRAMADELGELDL